MRPIVEIMFQKSISDGYQKITTPKKLTASKYKKNICISYHLFKEIDIYDFSISKFLIRFENFQRPLDEQKNTIAISCKNS